MGWKVQSRTDLAAFSSASKWFGFKDERMKATIRKGETQLMIVRYRVDGSYYRGESGWREDPPQRNPYCMYSGHHCLHMLPPPAPLLHSEVQQDKVWLPPQVIRIRIPYTTTSQGARAPTV
jgi:hypothetical protein